MRGKDEIYRNKRMNRDYAVFPLCLIKYTGIPSNTIIKPGYEYCGFIISRLMQKPDASNMYRIGTIG